MKQINNIVSFIFLLMLFSPLISYFLLISEDSRVVTFYFRVLMIPLGVIYIFTKSKIKIPGYLYFLLLYIAYLFIWTFYNGDFERRGFINILLNNINLSIFFVLLIIQNHHFRDGFIRFSVSVMKITVILAAIASIIQVFNQDFLIPEFFEERLRIFANMYQFRRRSIFAYLDMNEIGLSFIPLLSVLTGYLIYNKKRSYLIYLLLGGLVAFLSNGRYIMVGYIIILFQVLVSKRYRIVGIVRYATISFISLFVIYQSLVFLGYDIDKWMNQRIFPEGSIEETTRYKAFINFAYFFPDKPYYGTGVHLTDEIEEASREMGSSQIHVGYLSHLVSYGMTGSVLLFSFWFLLIRNLYRNSKKTNFWGSFFAFLVYLWAQATLVNYSIFFYGLIFAFIFDKYYHDKYIMLENMKKQKVLNKLAAV